MPYMISLHHRHPFYCADIAALLAEAMLAAAKVEAQKKRDREQAEAASGSGTPSKVGKPGAAAPTPGRVYIQSPADPKKWSDVQQMQVGH